VKFYLIIIVIVGTLLFNSLNLLIIEIKLLRRIVLLNKITVIIRKLNRSVKYRVVKLFERRYIDILLTTPTINIKFITGLVYINMYKGKWEIFLFILIILVVVAL